MSGREHDDAGSTRSRELYHILLSLLFLAVGIFTVWLMREVLGVGGDAVLVALLVLPLVLYFTLSGRVRELSAGDLSVKLNEVSREPVSLAATQYIAADLGPRIDPTGLIMKTDPNRPHVVSLKQGGVAYEREHVLTRLRDLAAMSPVPFLIILDDRERVLAYMTYRSALDVLQRVERGERFIQLVNRAEPDVFDAGGGFSAVQTETLPTTATNAEALSTMEKTGLNRLVVTDRKGRFAGIVERNRVLTRMMLALTSR